MQEVILVIHLLLAAALVATVLLQKSEGGGLGIGGSGGGGGGGGMGGFMTGRDAANLLTRTTAFLAAGFFATSMTLAIMSNSGRDSGSILDKVKQQTPIEQPGIPAKPSAPLSK